jgi:CheY-like chemotaxis protein
MPIAVLLTTDLMLNSAAQGAASRQGVALVVAPTPAAALTACSDQAAQLLAVDLRTPNLYIAALATQARNAAPAIHILAFGPHVHEASLAAAQAAGCNEVVTRGEFERRFEAALARLSAPGSARG